MSIGVITFIIFKKILQLFPRLIYSLYNSKRIFENSRRILNNGVRIPFLLYKIHVASK